jgi:NTE family protein
VIKLRSISLALSLLISGCASYGVIENTPSDASAPAKIYSLRAWSTGSEGWGQPNDSGHMMLDLAFSGGGTRAAALSYGVLKAMRDTSVKIDGRPTRFLDEIDVITSVSGGSFTSAYYGLHGEKIFTDFEDAFLRRDVEGALFAKLFNPFRWFGSTGRTEWAVQYYQEHVFHDATFADMVQPGRPFIMINATDLGYGARLSFIQEHFDLLCSDLSSFPVARAVTASSAVPVVFNPIVVENYADCPSGRTDWLRAAKQRAAGDARMSLVVAELETYLDKDKRKYAHYVDGGISDNLGLRALFEIVELSGGVELYNKKFKRQPPRRLVIILVDASTEPAPEMDASTKQPSLGETIGAMTDIQLHRYNVATIELVKASLVRWAKTVSTPQKTVTPYFIHLSFEDIKDPVQRKFFNKVPTSFRLTGEQVDRLIEAGGQLLHDNPEFRRLLADLRG